MRLVCVCFSKLLRLFFLLIYRRFHCSVFVLFFLICKYKGSIKQVDGNTTVEMCCVAKTISVFLVLLPTLLKPEIQAVLLSGALPCRVVECDGVQQCADQPAHARRPHARRGPQGAAQPHKGATLVPLPLICQQRSPERHLSSFCLRLRSWNDCGSECTTRLEGAAPFKTLLPQPREPFGSFGFYQYVVICHFVAVYMHRS